jgi:hypothetical protein
MIIRDMSQLLSNHTIAVFTDLASDEYQRRADYVPFTLGVDNLLLS